MDARARSGVRAGIRGSRSDPGGGQPGFRRRRCPDRGRRRDRLFSAGDGRLTVPVARPVSVSVRAAPFDVGAEMAALGASSASDVGGVGGIGCFVGVVRGGDGLSALTLEHYPGMTERAITAIADRAMLR